MQQIQMSINVTLELKMALYPARIIDFICCQMNYLQVNPTLFIIIIFHNQTFHSTLKICVFLQTSFQWNSENGIPVHKIMENKVLTVYSKSDVDSLMSTKFANINHSQNSFG